MINEQMMKFAQIRNSYARKKFGNLSNEDKALIEYDTFCLELMKEIEQLKENLTKEEVSYINLRNTYNKKCTECDLYKNVVEKAREWVEKRINSCTIEATAPTNDTVCRITIVALKRLLQILDKAKEEK